MSEGQILVLVFVGAYALYYGVPVLVALLIMLGEAVWNAIGSPIQRRAAARAATRDAAMAASAARVAAKAEADAKAAARQKAAEEAEARNKRKEAEISARRYIAETAIEVIEEYEANGGPLNTNVAQRKAALVERVRQGLRDRHLDESPLDKWLTANRYGHAHWWGNKGGWNSWAVEVERWAEDRWSLHWGLPLLYTSSSHDCDDDGPSYWATGNYDPDRYYAAAREYGWDHMHYIRDHYGDLDTYEANHPQ